MAAIEKNIAVVGWAQTPMIRRTDLSESQLLVRVDHRRAERPRTHPGGHRFHLSGLL